MSNNSAKLVTSNGGVTASEASVVPGGLVAAHDRLRDLEALFLGGPLRSANEAKCFSTETLLDVLMVLYNECCNSSLRKEKTVSDFIELGKTKRILTFHKKRQGRRRLALKKRVNFLESQSPNIGDFLSRYY